MEKHNKKPDLGDDLYAVLKKHEVPMVDANQIMHEIIKAVASLKYKVQRLDEVE